MIVAPHQAARGAPGAADACPQPPGSRVRARVHGAGGQDRCVAMPAMQGGPVARCCGMDGTSPLACARLRGCASATGTTMTGCLASDGCAARSRQRWGRCSAVRRSNSGQTACATLECWSKAAELRHPGNGGRHKRPLPGHNLTERARGKLTNPFSATVNHCGWGGRVRQGLSAAGGALGFFHLGLAADSSDSLAYEKAYSGTVRRWLQRLHAMGSSACSSSPGKKRESTSMSSTQTERRNSGSRRV